MRPILKHGVHPTQRHFVAGRDLARNIVELDMYAWALRSTMHPGDLPVLLHCDMTAAAFSSVSRRWLRAVF